MIDRTTQCIDMLLSQTKKYYNRLDEIIILKGHPADFYAFLALYNETFICQEKIKSIVETTEALRNGKITVDQLILEKLAR